MGNIQTGCLVLYKSRPARVTGISDKIDIEFDGGSKRVRDKDVMFLHPGPVADLKNLDAGSGALEDTLELLDDESVTLFELADLLYSDTTPEALWSSWQMLADGLYFSGDVDKIQARDKGAVAADIAAKEQKEQRQAAWDGLIARLKKGDMQEEDREALLEVEKLALDQTQKSRILQALEVSESKENAHRLLIRLGYWQNEFNLHPHRAGAPLSEPEITVPELLDEDRVDLTHLAAYAIDDEGSNDPDDAISIEGGRLWVHVADVAALAGADSDLDLMARERGANLYLPESLVPMFPLDVTHQLGLGLQDTSPALTVSFRITDEGELTDINIEPTRVQVTRITYAEADQQLSSTFSQMDSLLQRYQQKRKSDGAISLDFPEVSVRIREGDIHIKPLQRGGSRQMVTEAMLAAGEAAAMLAVEHKIAIPFAMQPPPQEIRKPKTLSDMYAYRRLFAPSRMVIEPEPHSGLGVQQYTRTTSPLRRYPDLLTHQQLRNFVLEKPLLRGEQIVERIGASIQASMAIRRAERMSNKHWKLAWLNRQKNWRGNAIVVELDERKMTFVIPEIALECRQRRQSDVELDQKIHIECQSVDFSELEARFRVLS